MRTKFPRSAWRRRLTFESLENRVVLSTAAEFALAGALDGLGTVTIRKVIAETNHGPIVCGSFTGTVDFDPGEGVYELTSAGGQDAFVASYDRLGRLLWATRFGGTGDDWAADLAFDFRRGISVVGAFSDQVEYEWQQNSVTVTSEGGTDAFVANVVARTGQLREFQGFGGPGDDAANGVFTRMHNIDIDVVGSFSETANFDPSRRVASSRFTLTSAGGTDAFMMRLAGSSFDWALRAGGPGDDSADAIQFNRDKMDIGVGNSVAIAGTFSETADLSFRDGVGRFKGLLKAEPILRTSAGGRDAFVFTMRLQYHSSGFTHLEAVVSYLVDITGENRKVQTIGGPGDQKPTSVAFLIETHRVGEEGVEQLKYVHYAAGEFDGVVTFDGANGAEVRTSAGGKDGFLARYETSSGDLQWVATVGGPGDDGVESIRLEQNAITAVGGFQGVVDFDPGDGEFSLVDSGAGSAFLWRLNRAGGLESAVSLGREGAARGIDFTSVRNATDRQYFVVGSFSGSVDFDPSLTGTGVLTAIGPAAGFFAKFEFVPDRAPYVRDDMYRVEAGRTLEIETSSVKAKVAHPIANDISRTGRPAGIVENLSYLPFQYGQTRPGIFNGFLYQPREGFIGTDWGFYSARDGDVDSNIATIYFTVVAPGTPPVRPDLYFDRESRGVWSWTEDLGMHQIHADSPEALTASDDGSLYLDFGPRGLWVWADGTYEKINDADPQGIAAAPSGGLAVDYGEYGLWFWTGSTIQRINEADPEGLIFGLDGALYVDYGAYGLWSWRDGEGFRRINAADPEGFAAGPDGTLYVDYGAYGLWSWRDGEGMDQINAANPEGLAVASDGSLLVDYGSFGLWRFRQNVGLECVNAADPHRLLVGAGGVVFVNFGQYGLFRWTEEFLQRIDEDESPS